MKKYITTILLTLCTTLSYSQSEANKVQEPETHRIYCEVKGVQKDFSSGLKIIIDFGNQASYNIWGALRSELKFVDDNGEEINFNSMVDAANYMVDKGWVFQQAYSSTYNSKPIIHWIFYKDVKNIEEAKKGIKTKSEFEKGT